MIGPVYAVYSLCEMQRAYCAAAPPAATTLSSTPENAAEAPHAPEREPEKRPANEPDSVARLCANQFPSRAIDMVSPVPPLVLSKYSFA